MQDVVPILYRHPGRPEWTDHLYGSGLTFKHGEVTLVPGYLYKQFLRHHEFSDARVGKAKSRPIDETAPLKTEEKDEPPLVDLTAMTKENIAMYAKRNFNLDISEGMKKGEMVELVRRQMGTEMPVSY